MLSYARKYKKIFPLCALLINIISYVFFRFISMIIKQVAIEHHTNIEYYRKVRIIYKKIEGVIRL